MAAWELQTCPDCGEEFKNLSVHKRHCKIRNRDEYMLPEQPLNSIISDIKQVLKRKRHSLTITTVEQDGATEEIEIKARIRLR